MVLLTLVISLFIPSSFAREGIFISDSHGLGAYGKEIHRWMKQHYTRSEFIASGGSAPLQWINNAFTTPCGYRDSSDLPQSPMWECQKFLTPSLKSILAHYSSPDVLIALGSNFGVQPEQREAEVRFAVKLIQSLRPEDRCYWLGPPDMKRFRSQLDLHYQILNRVMALTSQRCLLIDQRLFSHYPEPQSSDERPDGIHYDFPNKTYRFPTGVAAARDWAAQIIAQLDSLTSASKN